MIHKKTKISKSAVLLGTAMFFTMSPAWAGFEWTPPPAPEKVMMVPAKPSSPGAAPAPEVQSRAIKDRGNMASATAPAQTEPTNQISKMPPSMMEEPVVATVSPVSGVEIPAQDTAAEYDDVQGFGTDIPLVTAMSQIVPAGFAYSVDDPAMLGQKVSWTGGMAWNKALENAVKPLGLDVVVVDKTVWIREEMREPETASQTGANRESAASAEPMQAMKQSSTMTPRPPMTEDKAPSQPVTTARRNSGASPLRNMKPIENDDASSSYSRRNPIPMMMKAGEEEASDAPQPMTAMTTSSSGADSMTTTTQPQRHAAPSDDDGNRTYSHVVMPRSDRQLADGQNVNAKLDPFEIKYWTAEKGDSLRNVLTNWGQSAGTEIRWTSPYDYRLPFELKTHATFPDAVTKILTFYEDLEPRPVGRLHPNLPNGPSVLVIENYGTMVN